MISLAEDALDSKLLNSKRVP